MKSAKSPRTNEALERAVRDLAALLAPGEAEALARAPRTARPLVLVVGAPRSGATLALQWIAASGLTAYPTNLLARFAATPLIGARIHRLLLDPRYAERDELADLAPQPPGFTSELGRTSGALGVNGFEAFWRRFLPTQEPEPLGERTREIDLAALRRALAGLTEAYERPFAAKAAALQFDLAFFAEALPEALFVHVERDGVANARSLLDARKRLSGSYERWYGARPPEYWDLVALPPAEQVAGQVFHTNRHIRAALAELPEHRSLRLEYEALCSAPAAAYAALVERLGCHAAALGQTFDPGPANDYSGPPAFEAVRRERPKGAEAEAVAGAWAKLAGVPTP